MAADGEASRRRAERNASKVENLMGNFLEQLQEMKAEQRQPKKLTTIEESGVEPECAAYTLENPEDPEDPEDPEESSETSILEHPSVTFGKFACGAPP